MSYTYRYGEGSRVTGTGTRNIVSIAAGGVVTQNLAIVGVAVGDLCQIISDTNVPGNVAFYGITALAGVTSTLRPAPGVQVFTGQPADGQIGRLNRAAPYTLAASGVTNIIALGGGYSLVEVATSDFLTQEVEVNDLLAHVGGLAANNGPWYVHAILSQTQLIVRPIDGGAGMTTVGAGGTISIRRGVHRISGLNNAAPNWSDIRLTATPLPHTPSGLFQASGSIADYIDKKSVGGKYATLPRDLYTIRGLTFIDLDQSGIVAEANWVSQNEIAVNARKATPGTTGDMNDLRVGVVANSPPFVTALTVGEQGGNRFSAGRGSFWCGVFIIAANMTGSPQRMRVNPFGSMWDGVDGSVLGGQLNLGAGANAAASIIRPSCVVPTGARIESITCYGEGTVTGLISSGISDQGNTLIASTANTMASGSVGATLVGVLFSDDVSLPAVANTSGGLLTVRDPREDYDLEVYFVVSVGGGSIEKRYTFNPRFTALVANNALTSPAAFMDVEIYEINESTFAETLVFTGTTDINGQLANGVGTTLMRQNTVESLPLIFVTTNFSHRIVTRRDGQQVSETIQMKAPEVGDWPVEPNPVPIPATLWIKRVPS